MIRDKRIFAEGINYTVEPSSYLWEVIIRVNKNVLADREHWEGLTSQEIKDLITYHNDPYVLSFKSDYYANKWIKLAEEYL
ncbi:MAG: hypothetical protein ACRDB0_05100 [Paraclostridium sp.]